MHMVHHDSLSSIDLNLLVVLRALLNERHVTRAAARVGLSQSATSHALSRLRELYEDPLLVRSGRALQLTPRAVRLLPLLERGLSDLQTAVDDEPSFDPRTAKRAFSLGMADYLQALLMGPLLRRVAGEAPDVDLAVIGFPNWSELIDSGGLDLAVSASSEPVPSSFSIQELFEDGFTCMVRRDHPLIKKQISLAQYLKLRHIVVAPSGTTGSPVDTELARRGLSRRIALRVSNFLTAPIVVCQTDFINTMPTRLARQAAKDYPLRLLPTPLPVPKFGLRLVWHPRLDNDPAQRWLRQSLITVSKRC
ncbi:MAG: LysR family transcriptional regulator [Polyangiaceae bacterium]